MATILSNHYRFTNCFTGRFLRKFGVNDYNKSYYSLYMLPHYLVKSLISEKQAINDKLQGSVATYFRRDALIITN